MWTAATLPPELVGILDRRAGKVHSADGSVRDCLAEILNRYDEMRDSWACALAEEALAADEAAHREAVEALHLQQMDAIAGRDPDEPPQPVAVVEFPADWTDEQVDQFRKAWTGGPIEFVRAGKTVRAKVKWFGAGGNLIECQTRTAQRGLELHMLLAAWSDRPLMAEIDIENVEDDDA